MDSNIYTDLCCIRFGSFEEDDGTGRQWQKSICYVKVVVLLVVGF